MSNTMNCKNFLVLAVCAALSFCSFEASAQMTDEAVVEYVKAAYEAGKSKTQIQSELVSKGVTVDQAKRIMAKYQAEGATSTKVKSEIDRTRSGKRQNEASKKGDTTRKGDTSKGNADDGNVTDEMEDDEDNQMASDDVAERVSKKRIYGHDLFTSRNLSFEPNQNMATPDTYVLGPGDEIVIDVWGMNEDNISVVISSEGKVHIPQIGPVVLSGLSIKQATTKLRKTLSQKYSLAGDAPESDISVALGNVRTIQVNIIGEVKTPGTYRLSSLSNLYHALYMAGGVTEIGSLRNIELHRDGKKVCTSDVYSYLFTGSNASNVALKEGDVIIVPPYESVVDIKGGVKRPMSYEVKSNEPLQSLVNYAGGFTSNAHPDEITVERTDNRHSKAFTVTSADFASFKLQDGDIVTVYSNNQNDVFENRVEIKGSVMRPGVYAIGGEIATVRQLVTHAGGLLENAFLSRAQIIREKSDRSLEIVSFAVGALMKGQVEDVQLRKNDVVVISDVNEIETKGNVKINGFVNTPGEYQYAQNMTVEDLILLAEGLSDGARNARVEVSRRIIDPSGQSEEALAKIFSFDINEGLIVGSDAAFTLEPFDVVSVRRNPSFKEQRVVLVSGEAVYPGNYTLSSNNERLSDIFARAGGATTNAYLKGAVLRRKLNSDERLLKDNIDKVTKNSADTTLIKIDDSDVYTMGIDLSAALANPGSEADVILRNDDELIIPSNTNTVRIQGEVLYPNAVTYKAGMPISYYIKQAGGYNNKAKRSKVYVVYMNGSADMGPRAKVMPGCEIVVPTKPDRKPISAGEIIGIGSSAASLATMIVSITNMIKK